MADQIEHGHDHAEEVQRRNVEQARELLAHKHQQEQAQQAGEPPLEDDQFEGDPDPMVKNARGVRGSTGGIRNMGGGRA